MFCERVPLQGKKKSLLSLQSVAQLHFFITMGCKPSSTKQIVDATKGSSEDINGDEAKIENEGEIKVDGEDGKSVNENGGNVNKCIKGALSFVYSLISKYVLIFKMQ